MAKRKVIIDTDPGVDDVLALILALAAPELEILAITTVHGNIDITNTTRNVISLFNVLEEASKTDPHAKWAARLFENHKITLAAGAKHPLIKERQLDAAYFHGRDGLGGVSEVFPQFLPPKDWQSSFPALRDDTNKSASEVMEFAGLNASQRLAHYEILHILDSEHADTVTIVAVGPLTNISLACSTDYSTFSKVKEVVIMGGALTHPGNVTPTAEFNILADPESAAHVFSFTSPTPSSTYPLSPSRVPKNLSITLFPLDTTTQISLSQSAWDSTPKDGLLRSWCDVFLKRTFDTMKELYKDTSIEKVNLAMHDPACIWYLLPDLPTPANLSAEGNGGGKQGQEAKWRVERQVDCRIELDGRWTRGTCVTDRRNRQRVVESSSDAPPTTTTDLDSGNGQIAEKEDRGVQTSEEDEEGEEESDRGSWLNPKTGNRISWVSHTPGTDAFVQQFIQTAFPASTT